ncbi:hypothetical protein D3C86_1913950 [compost metagenome]
MAFSAWPELARVATAFSAEVRTGISLSQPSGSSPASACLNWRAKSGKEAAYLSTRASHSAFLDSPAAFTLAKVTCTSCGT